MCGFRFLSSLYCDLSEKLLCRSYRWPSAEKVSASSPSQSIAGRKKNSSGTQLVTKKWTQRNAISFCVIVYLTKYLYCTIKATKINAMYCESCGFFLFRLICNCFVVIRTVRLKVIFYFELQPVERVTRHFNPLKIPVKLQKELPFKSKPKLMKKRTTPSLESKRTVVMEPKEKSVSNDYVVCTDRR